MTTFKEDMDELTDKAAKVFYGAVIALLVAIPVGLFLGGLYLLVRFVKWSWQS